MVVIVVVVVVAVSVVPDRDTRHGEPPPPEEDERRVLARDRRQRRAGGTAERSAQGDGRWGRGGETVRGATSPDDGVPTYGIYLPAARAGAVLVMVEGVRAGIVR